MEGLSAFKSPNTLIVYQGGGYDGCFWEWNSYCIDANGEFHPLYTTGSGGIGTVEKIDIVLSKPYVDAETFPLTQEGIDRFLEGFNAQFVFTTAHLLLEVGYEFELKCEECEKYTSLDYGQLEGYASMGGIVIAATKILCEDCYCSKTCGHCGEYFEHEEDLIFDRTLSIGTVCKYCVERRYTSIGLTKAQAYSILGIEEE